MQVYIIIADTDGTLHSVLNPTGIGFTAKEKAEKYLEENRIGYRADCQEIEIKK